MARSSKLRVMISSKCDTKFPAGGERKLSEIRMALRSEIEAIEIAARKPFEVWVNEAAPPKGGKWDSWDVCLQAVRDCDILIVLSNGDAGWGRNGGEIGICHAELKTGLDLAPAKVRLIALPNIPITKDAAGQRNSRFQTYVRQQNLFRGGAVNVESELKARVHEAIYDAVIALTRAGVAEAARGRYHSGAALDWSRLDFSTRAVEMTNVVTSALEARTGAERRGEHLFLPLGGVSVLFRAHAIPAALTIGPAREMVGQPFLADHTFASHLTGSKAGGPLHIIACHKTATEAQAMKLLGFPDATIVAPPFGVFVADPVQKVQFAFITNCRDEANTRHGVQRFFEWLSQTGEEKEVADRAKQRAVIVQAIASVQTTPSTAGKKQSNRKAQR